MGTHMVATRLISCLSSRCLAEGNRIFQGVEGVVDSIRITEALCLLTLSPWVNVLFIFGLGSLEFGI